MSARGRAAALILGVLLASVIAATAAGSAGAVGVTFRFCDREPLEAEWPDPWQWWQATAWQLQNQCPRGYALRMVPEAPPEIPEGAYSSYLWLGPLPEMTRVGLTITGDDGSEHGVVQGFRVCDVTKVLCGALKTPAEPGRVELLPGTRDFPPDAARFLLIEAECRRSPTCTRSGEALFSELEVEVDDDEAPEIRGAGEFGWTRHPGGGPGVEFHDATSGIHRVVAPGLLEGTWESGCADIEARILYFDCGLFPGVAPELRAASFVEGLNEFSITAVDAAGNSTTSPYSYRLDTVAPPAPGDLRVRGSHGEWSPSRGAWLDWTNTGEADETSTASGLAQVEYDVDPVDSGWGDMLPEVRDLSAGENSSVAVVTPGNGRWRVRVRTIDRAGNAGEWSEVALNVDDYRPFLPDIAAIATVSSATAGLNVTWSGGIFGKAGICGHTRAINSTPAFQTADDLDAAAPPSMQWNLTPEDLAGQPDGRRYLHVRAISCSGVAGPVAHKAFLIDRIAPVVAADPAGGWITGDRSLTLSAVDGGTAAVRSGVAEITYSIDGATPVSVASSSADVALVPGMHSLVVRARDVAGNLSAPVAIKVGSDPGGPSVALDRPPLDDPTSVTAAIEDRESGVTEAWIDFRPVNGGPWRRLAPRFSASVPERGPLSIRGTIPDEGDLADGAYELRVVARDAAGNAAVAGHWSGGGAAGFELPARERPRLELTEGGRPLPDLLALDFARGRTVGGVVRRASGDPVAAGRIEIFETRPNGIVRRIGERATDAAGRFTFPVAPDVSRRVDFRFAGTPTLGPVSESVVVRTRARVTLRADRRRLRGRGVSRLTGRVDLSRAALPGAGFTVRLETLTPGVKPRAVPVSSDGSFAAPFTYSARRRPVRLRFRVVTPARADWPFARSRSNVVTVVIAP